MPLGESDQLRVCVCAYGVKPPGDQGLSSFRSASTPTSTRHALPRWQSRLLREVNCLGHFSVDRETLLPGPAQAWRQAFLITRPLPIPPGERSPGRSCQTQSMAAGQPALQTGHFPLDDRRGRKDLGCRHLLQGMFMLLREVLTWGHSSTHTFPLPWELKKNQPPVT